MGRRLGAKALVTGRISQDGFALVLTARIVDTATGAASLVAVRGGASVPVADMASDLSLKIGGMVLRRSEAEARQIWTAATIRGAQRKAGPMPFFAGEETACVIAIDGRAVPHEGQHSDNGLPLLPGRHGIAVLYSGNGGIASCELFYDAKPGAQYQLRFEDEPGRTIRIWIADLGTGRPAGAWVADRAGGILVPVAFVERKVSASPPPPIVIDRRMLSP
jgi:hypothetical protein